MICRFMKKVCLVSLSLVISAFLNVRFSYALEPESVLGEYWKDPLFGEAAAQTEVNVELLYKLLWPQRVLLNTGQKVRFNVENKTELLHVLALVEEHHAEHATSDFKKFVEEEVIHAEMKDHSAVGHHEHSVASGDAALSLVRTLDQKPTVTVRPDETKELIVRFDQPGVVYLRCVVEGHESLDHNSVIEVISE